ncbi:hypothetical protein [Brevundimonas sp. FT23042]|uniref:hypothetical protein n=1 Tax=Brevundimonas sp. FT23042 TaxID=3393749 RepID=UPI003B588ACC
MIRLVAPLAGLFLLALAGAASAQTYAPSWGQPLYLDRWGRPVGGTPLSEVEIRSYVGTGRWADGYSPLPHVHVPRWGAGYGYGYGHVYGRSYDYGRYRAPAYGSATRPYQGYRDEWGYNDDRARPGRQGYVDAPRYRHDRGPDVYLYDR